MADQHQSDITRLLAEISGGNDQARATLLPLIYEELRRIARHQRRKTSHHETLNTTALVHEAYVKLAAKHDATWENRVHFYRVASRAMRDVLVDYARRKNAAKRGGDQTDLSLSDVGDLPDVRADEILGIHEALEKLESLDPRQCRVVELRYFVGLTIPETAEVLDVSPATVRRDWSTARAWLQREIEQDS